MDPEELVSARERQIMELARYGKQSILQWEDVDVTELRRWHQRLREVVADEHEVQRITED